jgi:O-antigen ligase
MGSLLRSARHQPALLLLALAFLNVTGLLMVLTRGATARDDGSSLFFYAVAAPTSLYLLVRYARIARFSDLFVSFIAFMGIYLVAAISYSLANDTLTEFAMIVSAVYVFQMVFISSIYFWANQLNDDDLVSSLVLIKHFLLVSCLGVILSPFFVNQIAAETGRMSGFFADQNLAASGALLCMVLIVAFPPLSRVTAIIQAAIALAALGLTFSRTGFLALVVLAVFYFVTSPYRKWPVYILSVVVMCSLLGFALELGLFQLRPDQAQRVEDVFAILGGAMPQTRYEFRDILYDVGLERIRHHFPSGDGIGSFHSMEFGVRHRGSGHWLGVHNTYIMLVGEAGLVGIIAFAFFCFHLIARIRLPSRYRQFSVGAALVLASSMLTTHSVLNDKIAAAILSFLIVAASRSCEHTNGIPPLPRKGG